VENKKCSRISVPLCGTNSIGRVLFKRKTKSHPLVRKETDANKND
jgi:hypothetical protein